MCDYCDYDNCGVYYEGMSLEPLRYCSECGADCADEGVWLRMKCDNYAVCSDGCEVRDVQ